jgi:hypothetical protein
MKKSNTHPSMNHPQFMKLVRWDKDSVLVNYPISVPNRKRQARWLFLDEIYIDWVRTFIGEEDHGV